MCSSYLVYTYYFPIYQTTYYKKPHWQTIKAIYQFLRKEAQSPYGKTLYLLYDLEQQETLRAQLRNGDWIIVDKTIIPNGKIPNGTDALFTDVKQWTQDKIKYQQQQRKEAQVKEERRKKRELNDPDNPQARKRKARRHLQRLGYDLHKSRKIAKTADDYGLYQIVDRNGKIIAGHKYDLTLDQVERFYMDLDFVLIHYI